ncbi:hypothetical protein ABB37_07017 [Leptomonas pyrrhocoris]|uniref:CCHC-type domain-containing protein n=1 Tax=Leptomonas pyrrhocoris TaxID=157538 RepID=A0A0M9FWT4_LEPPY|nr:hypothetical protein ABB37_07017 [Leptomonas pyrrhocoris]XP_015656115.1 hypothetical protein ABB37_07017 [Leptomonas pyrrhocoris]KPA77675.1 hypothetical protein ABB37_07017 [Leptomonas pyrrhocoris]KPA77676.1 hypothetical protein ABB37_07017 [Leptomonas pyrrhocoris]|eukprot:XP_015656114.1 hypothetical protein ABB37_07017 [Leptomonas pyrrhocoris]
MSSAAATAAAMAATDAGVPRGVEDIIEQLRQCDYKQKKGEEEEGAGRESSGSRFGPHHARTPMQFLPLPPAVAAQHRVQLSIRGRRYETTMDVAVTYCLTFYAFFHCPFDGAMTVGDVALRRNGTEGAPTLSAQALLDHYTTVVEPLLLRFLQQQEQHPTQAGFPSAVGRADPTAAQSSSSDEDDARCCFPPALPRPRSIAYDAVGQLWSFEFPPRLTAAAEAQERTRRQQLAAAAAALGCTAEVAETHATSDDINASPFLLLQSGFMGMLLVYLRRCAKARAAEAAAYPSLPIRWSEMNFDEQTSFLQLLRAFGVVPLMPPYTRPSAPLSTSQFVGAAAARVAAEAQAAGDACSLRVKAEKFMRQQQQQQQHQREVMEDASHITQEPSGTDHFEDLVLPAKGCVRCGMAGHVTEECPY